ncbi:hypothetical protein E2I00_002003, partial [Balaenoptera physalus]
VLAPSPEAGHRAAASSSGRRGLLWRLRDKQSRLGLFEIGPGHELHQLTCMMQAGLWAATQVSMDHPPTAGARLAQQKGSPTASSAAGRPGHDQRFFLKTLRRREVRALLAHLPRYFPVCLKYDIKGCEVSRWVEPAPEGSPLVLVLKDLNFQGKTINLGPQRSWLLRQMELDTAFLRELNVLDYSLLMAFQRLHEDERGPGSSLIFRTARSMRGVQSLEEPEAQNRRLLPDAPNALHILDGPEQRYFLGLVDLATVYGLRKRLEH